MSKIRFEIFKNPKDYQNWDKHIEFAKKTTEYDEDFKLELKNAYTFLKIELGKGFLKNTKGRLIHSINSRLGNRIEESFLWFIWLANSIREFKINCLNYSELLDKLYSAKNFKEEGLPFIEIASKFTTSDFKITFEPLKNINSKNPDLRVDDITENETFYIEITRLNDSDERLANRTNYHTIFSELFQSPIKTYFSGKILKSFNKQRLNEIMIDLKLLKERASNNESIEHYLNSEVDIKIAHLSKENELKKWSTYMKYPFFDIQPIQFDFNEIDRIVNNKLVNKAKQIPNKNYGIICISINAMFLYINNSTTSIKKLEEKLNHSCFDNIIGVYLYSKIGRKVEDKIETYKKHVFGSRKTFDNYCEDFQFIVNENCSKKINPNTLDKIYNIFSS